MVRVIAHRGSWLAPSRAPRENTVEAFREAARLGAAWVELDARRTLDGVLVVHHDVAAPGIGAIAAHRRDDLPAWLPTLDEALDACAGMGVNVEVKDLPGEPGHDDEETTARSVAGVLQGRRRSHPGQALLVSSFSLAAVDAVRQLDQALPTAWLTLSGFDQVVAAADAAERGHVALHPQAAGVTAGVVVAAHDLGLSVNTWTVDDPVRIRELAALGVDGIVTNRVDVALDALAAG